MTKADVKSALISCVDNFEPGIDDNTPLTPGVNTMLTDQLASALDSLNPQHDYPPTSKP